MIVAIAAAAGADADVPKNVSKPAISRIDQVKRRIGVNFVCV